MNKEIKVPENIRQTTDLIAAILRRIREKKLDKTPVAYPDNGREGLVYGK